MKSPAPHCQSCQYQHVSLFKNCASGELDTISDNKCFNTYKKGQVIFHE